MRQILGQALGIRLIHLFLLWSLRVDSDTYVHSTLSGRVGKNSGERQR